MKHENRFDFYNLLLDKKFQKSYLTVSSVFLIASKDECLQNSNILCALLSSILLFITNIKNKIDWGGALVFERNPPPLKYCGNFDLALCFSHGISLSNQKYPLI